MHSIMIRGGGLVDGTGAPSVPMDVAIEGTKIAGLYKPGEGKAASTIDAKGLIVCPGFIDIHTHSDIYLLATPLADSKIRQGVTTELIGNCGGSPAPLIGAARESAQDYATILDIEIDWSTLDEYFLRLSNLKTSVNVASLVGADTLRQCVIGMADERADDEQLARMNRLLADSMLQGAFGLSSGLIYAPGCYASTEELIALASTSAALGGFYASHIRGESSTVVQAVAEAIRIGREAGSRVEISHHKACGKSNWGKVSETLKMIEGAREEGVDVAFDVYPYTASSTSLDTILPPWARDGGRDAILARLQDMDTRGKMAEELARPSTAWENTVSEDGWENIVVVGLNDGPNKRFENKPIPEIALAQKKTNHDAAFDLMLEEKLHAWAIFHEMSDDDVMTVMRHPLASIGSDGESEAPYGPTGRSSTHPRSYGTFPRVLHRYALEKGVFPIHEAIRRMTSWPAERIGLKDRGVIAKGMAADIVAFDPLRVRDIATFDDPHRYPEGIEYVLVNGSVTVERGEHTREKAGQIIRHKVSVA